MMNVAARIDYSLLCEQVALRLWGEPSQRTDQQLRWGNHGSRSLDRRKGCWFDHEAGQGGSTIELLQRECGLDFTGAVHWLRREGYVGGWGSGHTKTNGHAATNGHDRAKATPRKLVETYDYTDEHGDLRFQVCRFEPKDFRQRRPDGLGGWVWNLDGERRILYRLPEVIEEIAQGRPVFIVEGEKDADNLAAIGVVATTNPGGASKAKPGSAYRSKWLPEYSEFLRGADVILMPDNDETGRAHMQAVAASLTGVAKKIRYLDLVLHWPQLPYKGDISDWLADGGGSVDALWSLVETTDCGPAEATVTVDSDTLDLAEMNSQFAVVKVGGKTRVVSLEESPVYPGGMVPIYSTIPDFCAFHDRRKKIEIGPDGKDKKIGIGRWWINHEERRQYDSIVYAPNAEPAVGKMNLWRGFAVEPRSGDCGLYLDHLRGNICSGNGDHAAYLIDWMAYAVQHPDLPGEVAVVTRGKEGVGKGVLAKHFGGLFGSHFRHIVHAKHLVGHFNAHMQQCSVLFADEAFFAGDRAHESILKALITEETLLIEPKGVDPFPVRNCIHLIMSSNNDWVVPAGADARRYFVLNVSDAHMQDHRYFAMIAKQMENGGRAALLDYLLKRDLSGFDVRHMPQTEALAEQKAHSRRGIDRLVEIIANAGVLPNVHTLHPDVAVTTGEERGEGFYHSARSLVPDLKHYSSIVISNALKKDWDCHPWKSGNQRGIRFPSLAELRRHFDQRHGPQNWQHEAVDWSGD
jgi:Family of unknown function (DUF5906)